MFNIRKFWANVERALRPLLNFLDLPLLTRTPRQDHVETSIGQQHVAQPREVGYRPLLLRTVYGNVHRGDLLAPFETFLEKSLDHRLCGFGNIQGWLDVSAPGRQQFAETQVLLYSI
jgi:hypothetical protein